MISSFAGLVAAECLDGIDMYQLWHMPQMA